MGTDWKLGLSAVLSPTVAIFAGCFLASPAMALDRDIGALPAIGWNGFYIGGHLGYGKADFDGIFDSSEIVFGPRDILDSVPSRFFDAEGGVGGVHLGFNQTFGRFVVGLEADWSHVGWSDRVFDQEDEGPGGSTTDNASVDVNWLASLRGRLGVTSAQTLIYMTAGIAWVDADFTAQDADGFPIDTGSTDLDGAGFVVGGGIEHALTNQLAIRLEGLYYSFNNREFTSTLNNDSDPDDFAALKEIIVARLGMSYRFSAAVDPNSLRPSPSITWDGIYVGGHIGYGLVDFDSIFDSSEISNPFDNEDSVLGRFFDLDSGIIGGHFGYNYMFERYVIGIETDWSYVGQSDLQFDPDGGSPFDDSASVDINWLASVRGRLGTISAQTLFYVTAGIAWVDADYTERDDGNTSVGKTDLNDTGFVVGGGIEHALNNNSLIRFEALHYEFGDRKDTRSLTPDSDPGDFAQVKDVTVARIGLSYKFGSGTK